MAHEHSVIDKDTAFVVDAETMKISCVSEVKGLRRGDHGAERYSFSMPRYIEGHDMALCNTVEVHFDNINYDPKTRETTTNSSFDNVDDFGVSETDENTVVWTWLATGDATQLSGMLIFCIRFACLNGETIEYQKFTEPFESIPVGDIIFNTEAIAKAYPDVLGAMNVRIKALEESGGGGVSDYNELENKPIQRIESLDQTNLVNFRDLESGQYIIYGYFSPYANSDIAISADNSMISVIRKAAGTHVICLDPLNAKVVFFEILVDETEEKGYKYTRTIIPLLDLYALLEAVGNLEMLNTEDKASVVAAINEVASEIPVIPSKVSAFENDSGYLTKHQDLSGYAKTEDIPTDDHINELINTALGVIENGTY